MSLCTKAKVNIVIHHNIFSNIGIVMKIQSSFSIPGGFVPRPPLGYPNWKMFKLLKENDIIFAHSPKYFQVFLDYL